MSPDHRATLLALLAAPLASGTLAAKLPRSVPQASAPRDFTDDGRVFLELEPATSQAHVGVPQRVELRIGIERGFLESDLVPLFARSLDLPVEVRAPWLREPRGGRWLALQACAPSRTLALDGGIALACARADIERDGRTFALHALAFEWLPESPGELVLDGTELRLAYASAFDVDPFRGRVPRDRVDARVRGPLARLRALALPEQGRPPQFGGAVGNFTILTEAEPREVEVGGVLLLTTQIAGQGNFGHFAAPRIGPFDGLHVVSERSELGDGSLRIECELRVTEERVREIPPVELAYFTPAAPGRYEIARAPPLPLRVRRPMLPALTDISAPAPPLSSPLVLVVAGGLALIAIGLVLRARSRRGPPSANEHAMAADFETRLIRPGGDVTRLYPAYLAARLGDDPATVVTPDLAQRLEREGAPAELASRAAALALELAAANYGRKAPKDVLERARATVRELDHHSLRG
ncbi:MAG: protein BatD [Planctomycetes bacterium]|nr:protein BatD [Planctomycetota bacterium]